MSTIHVSLTLCFYPNWPTILSISPYSHQSNTIFENNTLADIVISRSLLHFIQLLLHVRMEVWWGLPVPTSCSAATGPPQVQGVNQRHCHRSDQTPVHLTHIYICVGHKCEPSVQIYMGWTCGQSPVQLIQGANHYYNLWGVNHWHDEVQLTQGANHCYNFWAVNQWHNEVQLIQGENHCYDLGGGNQWYDEVQLIQGVNNWYDTQGEPLLHITGQQLV